MNLNEEPQHRTTTEIELDHLMMVMHLAKPGDAMLKDLTPDKVYLLHSILGAVGELGEITDIVKKHIAYNKPLDLNHIIEELGDLEFYLAWFRHALSITRNETLKHNMSKLKARYPQGYTDKSAKERLDKLLVKAPIPLEGAM